MNVTFPTGMVNNLYADMYSALTVEIESSLSEEEISITTNTSSIRAFYSMAQGKHRCSSSQPEPLLFVFVSGVSGAMLSKPESCIITNQTG